MRRYKVAILAVVMGSASLFASTAYADSCLDPSMRMSDGDISSFISKPGDILSGNPVGGLTLSNQVRAIVASSTDSFDAVIGLVKDANKDQSISIGAGLARAVAACAKSLPGYADRIQQAVASLGNPDLIASFAVTNEDIRTAAVGVGGAGVGGGSTGTLGGRWAENSYRGAGDATSTIPNFTFSVSTRGQAAGSGT